MHLNNNVVIFSHQRRKRLENAQDFLSRPRSRPKSFISTQDQDLCFCPQGADRTTSLLNSKSSCFYDIGLKHSIGVTSLTFRVTWSHWSHDHWIPHRSFPIGGPFKPTL